MSKNPIARRNILKSALAGATVAAVTAPLAVHAQGASVTWRMQALWDGGTTPQKFEERFVARVGVDGWTFQDQLVCCGTNRARRAGFRCSQGWRV